MVSRSEASDVAWMEDRRDGGNDGRGKGKDGRPRYGLFSHVT